MKNLIFLFSIISLSLLTNIDYADAQTNTPPIINMQNPDPGLYLATTNIVISGNAFDAEDGSLHSQMQWSSNVSGFMGTGSFFTIKLPVGDHTITATVTDSGGLTSEVSVSGIKVVASNQPPAVTIITPSSGANFANGEPVIFEGSAIDDHDGDVSETLSWSSNIDGEIGTGPSFTTSELSVGTHTITVLAFDSFFWLGVNSATVVITDESGLASPSPPIGVDSGRLCAGQ